MWETKVFKTRAQMRKWIARNEHRVQYEEILVNNAFGVLYRKLRRIGRARRTQTSE